MGNIIYYEIPFERCSDFGRRRRWKAEDYDNNGKVDTDIIYIDVLTGSIFGNSKRRTKIYANIYTYSLVYLVTWDFKTQLVGGAIQFKPPETVRMGI